MQPRERERKLKRHALCDQIRDNGEVYFKSIFRRNENNDIKHSPRASRLLLLFTVHHPLLLVGGKSVYRNKFKRQGRGTVKTAIFQQIIDLFNANEYNSALI